MSYEAVVSGLAWICGLFIALGIGLRGTDITMEDVVRRGKKSLILNSNVIKLLFIGAAMFMMLLLYRVTQIVAEEAGYADIATVMDGGWSLMIFITLVFFFMEILSYLYEVSMLLLDIEERKI